MLIFYKDILKLKKLFIISGLIFVVILSKNASRAEDTASPTLGQNALSSKAMVMSPEAVGDLIRKLKTDLLEAQKQAYDREMELNRLKSQLKEQQQAEPGKTPWVEVNMSGKPGLTSEQPAVSSPESLKTSLQYYKHQYIIKPGDKLAVNFIGEDPTRNTSKESVLEEVNSMFLQNIIVLTDGTISLPPFGVIQVAGKTLKELNDEMNITIKQFYRFATITISLAAPASDDILVLGKVRKQGYVKVTVGTTLSQLFKEAGGIDEMADLSHVFIRKKANGNVYMADLTAFIDKGDIGQDMVLQSGDVVVVPEGTSGYAYERYAHTEFLPKEFEVKVLGAVGAQNAVTVKPGDDVAMALAKAGGLQAHASNNKIMLVREDEATHSLKIITFKQKDLLSPAKSSEVNVTLQPNDLIVVSDSAWKKTKYNLLTTGIPNFISNFSTNALFYKMFIGSNNNNTND